MQPQVLYVAWGKVRRTCTTTHVLLAQVPVLLVSERHSLRRLRFSFTSGLESRKSEIWLKTMLCACCFKMVKLHARPREMEWRTFVTHVSGEAEEQDRFATPSDEGSNLRPLVADRRTRSEVGDDGETVSLLREARFFTPLRRVFARLPPLLLLLSGLTQEALCPEEPSAESDPMLTDTTKVASQASTTSTGEAAEGVVERRGSPPWAEATGDVDEVSREGWAVETWGSGDTREWALLPLLLLLLFLFSWTVCDSDLLPTERFFRLPTKGIVAPHQRHSIHLERSKTNVNDIARTRLTKQVTKA